MLEERSQPEKTTYSGGLCLQSVQNRGISTETESSCWLLSAISSCSTGLALGNEATCYRVCGGGGDENALNKYWW